MRYSSSAVVSCLIGFCFGLGQPILAEVIGPSADEVAAVRQRSNIQDFTLQDLELSGEDSQEVDLMLGG